ncbi:MAG: hypothetical protein ACPGJV_02580 [Bacteriovoracaceae bacterium]
MRTKTINQTLINEWASQRPRPVNELAYKVGCSQTLARQIINGSYPKDTHPRYVYCQKIADVMGYKVEDLFVTQLSKAA